MTLCRGLIATAKVRIWRPDHFHLAQIESLIQAARAAVISVLLCRRALVSGVGVQLKRLILCQANGAQTAFDPAVILPSFGYHMLAIEPLFHAVFDKRDRHSL
jgi:hypothetical protein